jgi:archaellum component FlaC
MNPLLTTGVIRWPAVCFLVLICAGCALPSSATRVASNAAAPREKIEAPPAGQMTQEELQSAVISYANRFIATIGQAAFRFENKVPTKEGRMIASARKVYSLSAVTEIAAGPSPGAALLDLVVVSTLNRLVWEEYWRPQVFGMPAEIMVEAFKTMEDDAWKTAAKVMTGPQMEELRDLIMNWYYDHPGQIAVDYIRFSDFGDLGKKPNLKEIQKPGGLLAPVSEATRAVDEVRMTSERAMFLLTKMQLIMGFQVEQVYRQLAMQPEVETILADVSGFRKTGERFADLLEKLPDQVAAERAAAFQMVAGERKAVLAAFDDRQAAIHSLIKETQATLDRVDGTFAGLRQTTADVERLLAGTDKTARVFQDLVESVDRLAARFESEAPKEPSRPFDINEFTAALDQLQTTIKEMSGLVQSVDRSGTPLMDQITGRIDKAAQERIDQIFWRVAFLFAITGAILMAAILFHHWLRRRPN